ncbi:MAG: hypothetical protein JXR83_17755 [Deltaproteobacteria bacterium]|nr:hypothetical protein [Deltaproteobacteria bacterium]
MSVKGIQELRTRFLADNKIDKKEVDALIKQAEDGFLFIKHVSKEEKRELGKLLEVHADKFEPGAKEKLAQFLGVPLVTSRLLETSLAKLKSELEAARDSSGKVDLEKVASQIRGDRTAEAALEAIKMEFATPTPVTVSTGCSTETVMRDLPAKTISGAKVSSVFDALIEAKREIAGLDQNGDRQLDHLEQAAADRLHGLSGRVVKAAIEDAAKPERVGTSC